MAPSMSLAAKGLLPFGALPSSGVAQRPVSVTASPEHKTSDYKRKLLTLFLVRDRDTPPCNDSSSTRRPPTPVTPFLSSSPLP
uniref:Uncharacterized protein n=1 Tax=Aegilops tauschii subsp. strangulata TaxID=200361 RepID=A0A453DUQ2_AEGTS